MAQWMPHTRTLEPGTKKKKTGLERRGPIFLEEQVLASTVRAGCLSVQGHCKSACMQISALDSFGSVCPWATNIPSLILSFLVAVGSEDSLG